MAEYGGLGNKGSRALHTDRVNVLIAETDLDAQESLRSILWELGYRVFHLSSTREDVEKTLRDGPMDLIFTANALEDGPIGPTIRAVRLHALGPDPFVPMIATLAVADPAQVRAIVDDGPDDVLIKPLTEETVKSRIDRILNHRKPFVVTRDYLGPDRRVKPREDSQAAPAFEVPNRLKEVMAGTYQEAALRATTDQLSQKLLDMLVVGQAKGISYVLDQALPDWMVGHIGPETGERLIELAGLASSAVDLIERTQYAEHISIFRALQGGVIDIKAKGPSSISRYMGGLQNINLSLKRAFK